MKNRPLLLCGITALAATGLCVFLHQQYAWIVTAVGFLLAAVFLIFALPKERLKVILCAVTALACIGSFGAHYIGDYRYQTAFAGQFNEIDGFVREPMSDSYSGDKRVLFEINRLGKEALSKPITVALTIKESSLRPEIGSSMHFYAEIRPYSVYVGKDSVSSDLARGVYLRSEVTADSMASIYAAHPDDLAMMLARQKEKLVRYADHYFSEENAAVFCGMLYGERYGIEEELSHDFRYSGLSHLLAVSGLHIQVIAAFIAFLCRNLLFFLKKRNSIASVLTLFFMWGFILLIGCPVSALRSGIMVTFGVIGGLIRQRADSLNSLGLSAVLILIFLPFSICSLGFWMSLLASFGIASFGKVLRNYLGKCSSYLKERYRKRLKGAYRGKMSDKAALVVLQKNKRFGFTVRLTKRFVSEFIPGLSAAVGLLPVYLCSFGYLPIGALVAAPVLSVLFSLIIVLGMLFTICSLFRLEGVLGIASWIIEPLLELLRKTVAFFAAKPYLSIPLRQEFALAFAVCGAAFLVFLFFKRGNTPKEKRYRRAICVFFGLFFGLGLLFTQFTQYNSIEISAIGGNSGKDVVVLAKNRASIFLCHSTEESDDPDENLYAIATFLRQRGAHRIAHIYVMQPTEDLPNGIEYLQKTAQVEEILLHSGSICLSANADTIKPGDAFLNRDILVNFLYEGESLHAAIKARGSEIDIVQNLSVINSGKIGQNSSAVFLTGAGKVGETVQTPLLIMLSDRTPDIHAVSGKVVRFTEEVVTLRLDSSGFAELS